MITLRQGIFLEDIDTLLPWGVDRAGAWKVKGATHYNLKDDDTRIKWEANIFGGLRCGILAYLPDQNKLSEVHIWRLLDQSRYPREPWYAYMQFFDHFLTHIGPPSMMPSAGSHYAPFLTWRADDCTLSLSTGERFGDFTSLVIKK